MLHLVQIMYIWALLIVFLLTINWIMYPFKPLNQYLGIYNLFKNENQ